MQFFRELYHLLSNLGDESAWQTFISFVGAPAVYATMFAIVFIETGFVIMPFLPGDSLLFALGAIGARDVGINLYLASGLLILAALLGDNVNYWIGRKLGPAVFRWEHDPNSTEKPPLICKLLSKKHLVRTEVFFEKYGAKAVILARFIAIIRTFTPFVAGMGKMYYPRFVAFSIIGAVIWVSVCVSAGAFFGQIPFVRKHFELVILGIIFVTVLPVAFEIYKGIRESRRRGFPAVQKS